jgi:transcription antitermination factor NusG
MPLLPLETFVFPPDLFTGPSSGHADGANCWWALHTRPRAEKSLARRLLARDIPFFLPLYQRQARVRGRLFCSHLPLFPGYLFLRGEGQFRLAALETNLVVRVLPVVDQDQLQKELTHVYQLVASGAPLSPEDQLQPGRRVEVTAGPLIGLEGKVLRRGKRLKFFVEVQLLQRGVSVEVESWMIQPVGERSRVG